MNNQSLPGLCPPELKELLPFLVRARDFDSKDPQVSYQCKGWAVQVGIEKLGKLDGEAKDKATKFLMSFMDHLEDEKKDPNKSGGDGKAILLKYAYQFFKRADDRERTPGQADKACASTFMTASILMEATKQYGPMDNDTEQRHRYCRYTAGMINKALKAGEVYQSPNEPIEQGPDIGEDELNSVLAEASQPSYVDPTPTPAPAPVQPPAAVQPTPAVPQTGGLDAGIGGFGGLDDMLSGLAAKPATIPTPVAPVPSPPVPPPQHTLPPPPQHNVVDDLLAGIPTTAPYEDVPIPQVNSDLLNSMEDRLAQLTTPAAPAVPVAPVVPDMSGRVAELEDEVHNLKHQLAVAQQQQASSQQQLAQYQQALTVLKGQLAQQQAASGSLGVGGGAGIIEPTIGFHPTIDDMTDIQKFSKYVISALQFKDVKTARDNLMKSLSRLNGHG
eukprot:TRINITY_DN2044_c1_g2_i1.p1 TRINITY_DN2044_c1_g2~~TRINITY_DN2044_c1_g2_i1.p1  ORF type:complete len:444 (+),score=112.14 TRINITY_DN2044_c1_g2_i1:55-1386(+)